VLYDKCDEFLYPETMRERKKLMEEMSDAFIMTPGGIGTYEEFFEILTLKQLDRHPKAIAILNTLGYYDLMNELLQRTTDLHFMKEASLQLFESFSEPSTLLDYLETYKEIRFDITETKHIQG